MGEEHPAAVSALEVTPTMDWRGFTDRSMSLEK